MKNAISILFGLFPVIVIIALFAALAKWLHNEGLDIFVGVIVGLLPSIILVYQRKKEREEDYKNWLLQNRGGCAIELVDILISTSFNSNGSTEKSEQYVILKRVKRLMPSLLVWGSPKLLKQWEGMQTPPAGEAAEEVARRGERFIRVIRQSLGHDDSQLAPGALLASIVKPDEKDQIYKACQGERYD